MAIRQEDLNLTHGNTRPLLQATEDRNTLAYVQDLFEKSKKGRIKFEQQWYLNMAFYFGRQYVMWKGGGIEGWSQLYEPPAPHWRVRIITNKIRPIVRTELSKLTKEKPQAFVIPASTDDEDLAAARAGESVFEHLWRDLGVNRTIRRAVFWELLCGTAFLKDWVLDNGDIKVEAVTPFHLYPSDYQEEDLEAQSHLIHVIAKSPDWVEQKYNRKVQADTNAGAGVLEQKFLSALGVQQNAGKDYVAVKEAWIKPNSKYKQGAVITWAGDTILNVFEGELFQHGEYPFTKFDHVPTGRFYGDSIIPDLIPLQKEFNRTRSQLSESKNRMSKPQLLAPKGSVDPSKVTSEPGLIIQYQPGFNPPTPLTLQNIPNYVINELERIQMDIDDLSGRQQINRGVAPPGVSAATALSFLGEQADNLLFPSVASIEEGTERLGRHFLSHVQQFWNAQRKIKVIGLNNQLEAHMIGAADIRGNTDLKVEAGSAMPRSRAAKQAFITELGKMGWIPPDRALRYLDMAETGRLYEEMQIDARQAQRENLKMSKGIPITVNPYDNDLVHITEHENHMKRQEFEEAEDEIKQIHLVHLEAHRNQLMNEQQEMMMRAMMTGQMPDEMTSNGPPKLAPGQPTQELQQGPSGPVNEGEI